MTDYSEMKDNEIDRMVGAITGSNEGLDYCSDPSACWPIILDHKIDISWSHWEKYWYVVLWDYADARLPSFSHTSENPLRAAMIVFLMMNESEG